MTGSEIQVENGGFTRIKNEILELFAVVNLSGREFRCLNYLLRMTYGYGKKEDKISYSQFSQGTKIDRKHIVSILASLERRKIIICKRAQNNQTSTWGFNKYFEEWDVEGTTSSPVEGTTSSPVEGTTSSPVEGTTSSPVEGTTSSPVEGTTSSPVEGTTSSPVEGTTSSPVEGTTSSPVEGTNKRNIKKEIKAAAAAAEISPPICQNECPNSLPEFIGNYKQIWESKQISQYHQQKIEDWARRVTLRGWIFALKQAVDNDKVGKWNYLEAILRRVELEDDSGLQGTKPKRGVETETAADVDWKELFG